MTFRARPAQAYFLQPYEVLPLGLPTHALGATREVKESCPHCDRPLSTLLSLNTSDERLELSALCSAQLTLCVCPICREARYALTGDGEVIALYSPQTHPRLSAFELLPPEFCPVALHAVPDRIAEARTLAAEGRLEEAGVRASDFDWQSPANQVGGRPAGSRGKIPSPTCPRCGTALPFLASVICGIIGPAIEGETGHVQVLFFVCRECPAIIAITPDSELPEQPHPW